MPKVNRVFLVLVGLGILVGLSVSRFLAVETTVLDDTFWKSDCVATTDEYSMASEDGILVVTSLSQTERLPTDTERLGICFLNLDFADSSFAFTEKHRFSSARFIRCHLSARLLKSISEHDGLEAIAMEDCDCQSIPTKNENATQVHRDELWVCRTQPELANHLLDSAMYSRIHVESILRYPPFEIRIHQSEHLQELFLENLPAFEIVLVEDPDSHTFPYIVGIEGCTLSESLLNQLIEGGPGLRQVIDCDLKINSLSGNQRTVMLRTEDADFSIESSPSVLEFMMQNHRFQNSSDQGTR